MKFAALSIVALCYIWCQVSARDNGLAKTPPMGFMNWQRFRCNIDCLHYPNDCVSEKLFMTMADAMVANGMKDSGYVYLSIDDCWLSKNRTADGKLQADPQRFPSGMKALSKYMHDRGLKLGIYEDEGTETCAGYPGSEGHEEVDAQTFADWDLDMLKYDGCNVAPWKKVSGWKKMGDALDKVDRDILYLCEWPVYVANVNWKEVSETCNVWRNWFDVNDSWESVFNIINFNGQNNKHVAQYQAPGAFNDLDELLIGDHGLSYTQQKIQMAFWALASSPMLVSSDLRTIDQQSLDLLLNKKLIAINQDVLGAFPTRVVSKQKNSIQAWSKKLGNPYLGKYAVFFFVARDDDQTQAFTYSLKDLGVEEPPKGQGFILSDVFSNDQIHKGVLAWDEKFTVMVPDYDTQTFLVIPANLPNSHKGIFF